MPEINKIMGGLLKHHAETADGDNEIWLFDNTAVIYEKAGGEGGAEWRAEYVLAGFARNETWRQKIGAGIAELAQIIRLAPEDNATEKRIKDRMAPFIRQISPKIMVDIHYHEIVSAVDAAHAVNGSGTSAVLHLGPADGNGIISQEVPVPVTSFPFTTLSNTACPQPGMVAKMSVVTSELESPSEHSVTRNLQSGHTYFTSPQGWGVISDIDDTIKVTEVRDRIKLLKHTFVDEHPSPVAGIPQFYTALNQALSTKRNPATWMYLSASPYNLYPFLRSFIKDSGLPGGQIILRDMSWMDMESFVTSLTKGTKEYKDDRMKKIASWLPEKTWVCIGDTTQTDPEAYAEFYGQLVKASQSGHKGRVARIYIHKVVGVNPKAEKELNDPKRFEKTFKDVPRDIWKIFESSEELYGELDGLKREVRASDPDPDSTPVSDSNMEHDGQSGKHDGHHRRHFFGLI